jgi:hypothetical protein
MTLTLPECFRLYALRAALRLECKGMRNSRGSVAKGIRELIGSTERNKAKLLVEFEQYLLDLKGTE